MRYWSEGNLIFLNVSTDLISWIADWKFLSFFIFALFATAAVSGIYGINLKKLYLLTK